MAGEVLARQAALLRAQLVPGIGQLGLGGGIFQALEFLYGQLFQRLIGAQGQQRKALAPVPVDE